MKKIISLLLVSLFLVSVVFARSDVATQAHNFKDTIINNIDIDRDVVVCCYEYGLGAMMVKVNERHQWREESECAIDQGFTGGGKEIVDKSMCGEMRLQTRVQGLENAILRVRTQERAQHLEQVMNKIQEQRKMMLMGLDNLVVEESDEGEIKAEGKRDAKLLNIFKLKHTYKYNIAEDGTVVRQKRWFDMFWKDIEEVE